MTLKEFFSFKANRFFWLNLAGMVVVFCLLVYGVLCSLDAYTRHGVSVEVPAVRNLSVEEAGLLMQKQGLQALVVDSSYVKTMAPGRVLEQKPTAGSRVKRGRTVYLTINTLSVPQKALPDVADNSSYRQAQARLLAMGFSLTEPEYVPGEKDWVVGVKYAGEALESGAQVPLGAVLTLVVGNGEQEAVADSLMLEEDVPVQTDEPVVDKSWF